MKLVKTAEGLQLSAPGIGKRVVFAPCVHDDAVRLDKAARAGYYYPLMALKHLNALSTGLAGKNNVFIPNINDFKTNSLQQVVVFVPGIAATVERRANDSLVVTRLVLSDEYESIARGSNQKPGVYSVARDENKVRAEYRTNARITSKDERKVVIADPRYPEPNEAAAEAAKRLESLFSSDEALKCDFDLFYSPLGGQLKGMRNYNPAQAHKTFGFAGLLADAMEQAKNKKGVVWASERAGSTVFTQALMTLAQKNVSFQGQNHIAKMRWAKSNPRPAFTAASQLGMLVDKNMLHSSSHVKASLSAALGNAGRAKDQNDPYNWGDYSKDLANGTMAANTVIGIGALAGSALISAPTAAATLGAVGVVTGTVGALQFALKKFNDIKERR